MRSAVRSRLLYTAKGTASLLVPLPTCLAAASGWLAVFIVAALMNAAAAIVGSPC